MNCCRYFLEKHEKNQKQQDENVCTGLQADALLGCTQGNCQKLLTKSDTDTSLTTELLPQLRDEYQLRCIMNQCSLSHLKCVQLCMLCTKAAGRASNSFCKISLRYFYCLLFWAVTAVQSVSHQINATPALFLPYLLYYLLDSLTFQRKSSFIFLSTI